MSDLDKLIEAVEGGVVSAVGASQGEELNEYKDWFGHELHEFIPAGYFDVISMINFCKAYDGSLDAAKALHEALLPGWIWGKRGGEIAVQHWGHEFASADRDNPARAWLIAVLKAYRSQQC